MPVQAGWSGATTDWNVAADWSDVVVPNNLNTGVTIGGVAAYKVTISAGESFTAGTASLSDVAATPALNGNASLTLGGGLTTVGTLDVDNAFNDESPGDPGGSTLSIGQTLAVC
jgi:hypothetical protein